MRSLYYIVNQPSAEEASVTFYFVPQCSPGVGVDSVQMLVLKWIVSSSISCARR